MLRWGRPRTTKLVDQHLCELDLLVSVGQPGEGKWMALSCQREVTRCWSECPILFLHYLEIILIGWLWSQISTSPIPGYSSQIHELSDVLITTITFTELTEPDYNISLCLCPRLSQTHTGVSPGFHSFSSQGVHILFGEWAGSVPGYWDIYIIYIYLL